MKKEHASIQMKTLLEKHTVMADYYEESVQRRDDFLNRVLIISDDSFGKSDADYSKKLLKSYLKELSQSKVLPKVIILLNRGVLLTLSTSPVLDDLRVIESKGVVILSNCSCLEYYKAMDLLAVGGITTMSNIIEITNTSKSVMTL